VGSDMLCSCECGYCSNVMCVAFAGQTASFLRNMCCLLSFRELMRGLCNMLLGESVFPVH
jgi:hypothetical protein